MTYTNVFLHTDGGFRNIAGCFENIHRKTILRIIDYGRLVELDIDEKTVLLPFHMHWQTISVHTLMA